MITDRSSAKKLQNTTQGNEAKSKQFPKRKNDEYVLQINK